MHPTPPRSRLTLMAVLTAAGTALSPAQNPNSLQLQFITFPATSEVIELDMVISRTETKKIEVTSSEVSRPVRVPRLNTLIFGETLLDADNKPVFKEYGRGQALSTNKQIVLILRRGKAISEGFEVRAVAADTNDFGGGKLLFLNAAETAIGGKAGGQPFALQPGRHAIVKPKPEPDGRRIYVEFSYQTAAGTAEPFFHSFWPIDDESRGLIFFYRDPERGNKITMHTFREFLFELEPLGDE